MTDYSINKLSEKDINRAYRFIYIFEKEVYNKYGTFNFESQEIKHFCREYGMNKKVKRNTKLSNNYFWFDTRKVKGAQNSDYAHNLLRHIRNAMAHGNFKKERNKKAFYILEDYDKNNNQTMYGQMSADIFWKYLNIVLHSSPMIDNNIKFN